MKKRVFTVIVVVVLIYLFMTSVGISLLADASIFVGRLLSGNRTDQENSNYLDTLTVDPPEKATSSDRLTVTGFAHGYVLVEFYLNDKKVLERPVKSTENFSEIISGLTEGTNEIYVVASSPGKKEKQSNVFKITYLAQKPALEVTEPSSASTVRKEDLTIKGKTTPENAVKVNGAPTIVDTTGAFEYSLRLKVGENKIQVVATDAAGNTAQLEISVKYEKE